eukprot:768301-Pleurochrysis_carterae.AAC.6
MIAFLAWLVHMDVLVEASFFCMIKGHEYSWLDQSFSALIKGLKPYAVYTVTSLLQHMAMLLRSYTVVECREVHCFWNFKDWLGLHLHTIRGYATSQYGDGMHEFLFCKDSNGEVRVLSRKSSQASQWAPEGDGYKIFKNTPPSSPEFAPFKSDAQRERQTVASTVHLWLPHFT